jgi:hypothetical protein
MSVSTLNDGDVRCTESSTTTTTACPSPLYEHDYVRIGSDGSVQRTKLVTRSSVADTVVHTSLCSSTTSHNLPRVLSAITESSSSTRSSTDVTSFINARVLSCVVANANVTVGEFLGWDRGDDISSRGCPLLHVVRSDLGEARLIASRPVRDIVHNHLA